MSPLSSSSFGSSWLVLWPILLKCSPTLMEYYNCGMLDATDLICSKMSLNQTFTCKFLLKFEKFNEVTHVCFPNFYSKFAVINSSPTTGHCCFPFHFPIHLQDPSGSWSPFHLHPFCPWPLHCFHFVSFAVLPTLNQLGMSSWFHCNNIIISTSEMLLYFWPLDKI